MDHCPDFNDLMRAAEAAEAYVVGGSPARIFDDPMGCEGAPSEPGTPSINSSQRLLSAAEENTGVIDLEEEEGGDADRDPVQLAILNAAAALAGRRSPLDAACRSRKSPPPSRPLVTGVEVEIISSDDECRGSTARGADPRDGDDDGRDTPAARPKGKPRVSSKKKAPSSAAAPEKRRGGRKEDPAVASSSSASSSGAAARGRGAASGRSSSPGGAKSKRRVGKAAPTPRSPRPADARKTLREIGERYVRELCETVQAPRSSPSQAGSPAARLPSKDCRGSYDRLWRHGDPDDPHEPHPVWSASGGGLRDFLLTLPDEKRTAAYWDAVAAESVRRELLAAGGPGHPDGPAEEESPLPTVIGPDGEETEYAVVPDFYGPPPNDRRLCASELSPETDWADCKRWLLLRCAEAAAVETRAFSNRHRGDTEDDTLRPHEDPRCHPVVAEESELPPVGIIPLPRRMTELAAAAFPADRPAPRYACVLAAYGSFLGLQLTPAVAALFPRTVYRLIDRLRCVRRAQYACFILTRDFTHRLGAADAVRCWPPAVPPPGAAAPIDEDWDPESSNVEDPLNLSPCPGYFYSSNYRPSRSDIRLRPGAPQDSTSPDDALRWTDYKALFYRYMYFRVRRGFVMAPDGYVSGSAVVRPPRFEFRYPRPAVPLSGVLAEVAAEAEEAESNGGSGGRLSGRRYGFITQQLAQALTELGVPASGAAVEKRIRAVYAAVVERRCLVELAAREMFRAERPGADMSDPNNSRMFPPLPTTDWSGAYSGKTVDAAEEEILRRAEGGGSEPLFFLPARPTTSPPRGGTKEQASDRAARAGGRERARHAGSRRSRSGSSASSSSSSSSPEGGDGRQGRSRSRGRSASSSSSSSSSSSRSSVSPPPRPTKRSGGGAASSSARQARPSASSCTPPRPAASPSAAPLAGSTPVARGDRAHDDETGRPLGRTPPSVASSSATSPPCRPTTTSSASPPTGGTTSGTAPARKRPRSTGASSSSSAACKGASQRRPPPSSTPPAPPPSSSSSSDSAADPQATECRAPAFCPPSRSADSGPWPGMEPPPAGRVRYGGAGDHREALMYEPEIRYAHERYAACSGPVPVYVAEMGNPGKQYDALVRFIYRGNCDPMSWIQNGKLVGPDQTLEQFCQRRLQNCRGGSGSYITGSVARAVPHVGDAMAEGNVLWGLPHVAAAVAMSRRYDRVQKSFLLHSLRRAYAHMVHPEGAVSACRDCIVDAVDVCRRVADSAAALRDAVESGEAYEESYRYEPPPEPEGSSAPRFQAAPTGPESLLPPLADLVDACVLGCDGVIAALLEGPDCPARVADMLAGGADGRDGHQPACPPELLHKFRPLLVSWINDLRSLRDCLTAARLCGEDASPRGIEGRLAAARAVAAVAESVAAAARYSPARAASRASSWDLTEALFSDPRASSSSSSSASQGGTAGALKRAALLFGGGDKASSGGVHETRPIAWPEVTPAGGSSASPPFSSSSSTTPPQRGSSPADAPGAGGRRSATYRRRRTSGWYDQSVQQRAQPAAGASRRGRNSAAVQQAAPSSQPHQTYRQAAYSNPTPQHQQPPPHPRHSVAQYPRTSAGALGRPECRKRKSEDVASAAYSERSGRVSLFGSADSPVDVYRQDPAAADRIRRRRYAPPPPTTPEHHLLPDAEEAGDEWWAPLAEEEDGDGLRYDDSDEEGPSGSLFESHSRKQNHQHQHNPYRQNRLRDAHLYSSSSSQRQQLQHQHQPQQQQYAASSPSYSHHPCSQPRGHHPAPQYHHHQQQHQQHGRGTLGARRDTAYGGDGRASRRRSQASVVPSQRSHRSPSSDGGDTSPPPAKRRSYVASSSGGVGRTPPALGPMPAEGPHPRGGYRRIPTGYTHTTCEDQGATASYCDPDVTAELIDDPLFPSKWRPALMFDPSALGAIAAHRGGNPSSASSSSASSSSSSSSTRRFGRLNATEPFRRRAAWMRQIDDPEDVRVIVMYRPLPGEDLAGAPRRSPGSADGPAWSDRKGGLSFLLAALANRLCLRDGHAWAGNWTGAPDVSPLNAKGVLLLSVSDLAFAGAVEYVCLRAGAARRRLIVIDAVDPEDWPSDGPAVGGFHSYVQARVDPSAQCCLRWPEDRELSRVVLSSGDVFGPGVFARVESIYASLYPGEAPLRLCRGSNVRYVAATRVDGRTPVPMSAREYRDTVLPRFDQCKDMETQAAGLGLDEPDFKGGAAHGHRAANRWGLGAPFRPVYVTQKRRSPYERPSDVPAGVRAFCGGLLLEPDAAADPEVLDPTAPPERLADRMRRLEACAVVWGPGDGPEATRLESRHSSVTVSPPSGASRQRRAAYGVGCYDYAYGYADAADDYDEEDDDDTPMITSVQPAVTPDSRRAFRRPADAEAGVHNVANRWAPVTASSASAGPVAGGSYGDEEDDDDVVVAADEDEEAEEDAEAAGGRRLDADDVDEEDVFGGSDWEEGDDDDDSASTVEAEGDGAAEGREDASRDAGDDDDDDDVAA
uniref:ICP4-like protein n=1 Tax=Anatid alphaherpesvirus 2 TaxID=3080522 RepID=A0AAU0K8A7_9ALPH